MSIFPESFGTFNIYRHAPIPFTKIRFNIFEALRELMEHIMCILIHYTLCVCACVCVMKKTRNGARRILNLIVQNTSNPVKFRL